MEPGTFMHVVKALSHLIPCPALPGLLTVSDWASAAALALGLQETPQLFLLACDVSSWLPCPLPVSLRP